MRQRERGRSERKSDAKRSNRNFIIKNKEQCKKIKKQREKRLRILTEKPVGEMNGREGMFAPFAVPFQFRESGL